MMPGMTTEEMISDLQYRLAEATCAPDGADAREMFPDLHFTQSEAMMLSILLRRRGAVVRYGAISVGIALPGKEWPGTNVLYVHLCSIRKKVGGRLEIRTIPTVGLMAV